jgi:hypothetical protein
MSFASSIASDEYIDATGKRDLDFVESRESF